MSGFTLARATTLAAVGVIVGLAVACASDPTPAEAPATFCSQAQSSAKTCEDPADCDATLTAACKDLGKVLSPTTMQAAQDCLESGVCGPANCLTHAQASSKATSVHDDLAQAFCSLCAPDVTDCTTQFYSKQGRLPGVIVLPYGETVAAAVKDACTTDAKTCRSNFATCATETIARVVSESLDPDVATCVTSGFRRDDDTAPGGGPVVLKCNASNCTGCCRNDKCDEGTSENSCGTGGAGCQMCVTGQACKAGECKEPCGPNNCKGCCDGDACLLGNDDAKCGSGGLACDACTTQGPSFICSKQTCIDSACQANCVNGCCSSAGCQPGTAANACGTGGEACIDCGYGRACNDARACELDRSSIWNFTVLSAVVPDKTKSGGSWELFGDPPDPYVIVYSSLGTASHTGQTTVKNDTLTPSFVETPLKGIRADELLDNLSFEIWDSDVDFDDLIGGCAVSIQPEQFNGLAWQVTCPPTASNVPVTLTYKITKP